jgi:hypothetical protein
MSTTATATTMEPWVGYRDGQAVAEYPDRYAADAALTRREVDSAAPWDDRDADPAGCECEQDWNCGCGRFGGYTWLEVRFTDDGAGR